MKIFNTVLVGPTSRQENAGAVSVPSDMHGHSNLSVLSRITVDAHGVLLFDGQPVDTVGQEFVNASILEQFSVVDNKLLFAGTPVDTTWSVFDNDAVLRMFSQSAEGTLLFNGMPIEGGAGLPNADDLQRLSIDENGQLTVDGVVVSGSGGAVTLSVVKLGSGTALLKGIIGTDLQTRSLVAGSNVTLDVTGDEIKINASLSGAVSVASTFKQSDGYAATQVLVDSASQILAAEAPTDSTGLLFLARLGSDVKATVKDVALPITGSVTPATVSQFARNRIATAFANGKLVIPNGTTYSDTSPATWFAGTVDWTIECDFVRSASNQGTLQNLVSGWCASGAASSAWVGILYDNKPYVAVAVGATLVSVTSSVAVTDTNKHHVEATRTGGVLRLFLDGMLVGSEALTGSVNAGSGFSIGDTVDGVAPFYGHLRDVKIYNYAKHTAAYTVDSYFKDNVGVLSKLDMSGKLLSASFWKQITSISVVSTETATAYLKWLMVDANGYWTWDAVNKVWIASDVANIATAGMTTAEVREAFTNNQWNYRSDSVGFAIAFVTTDGNSTPVLTSATIAAVQSADKTSGHTVLDAKGAALPQRSTLKFVGMDVTDEGQTTTVKGATLSRDLLHAGTSLESVVDELHQNSGRIGTTHVDLNGVQNGSTLAFDASSNQFKVAAPAQGASGNGLYVTAPFTLDSGEEKTITHQLVLGGRAVYQADRILEGEDLVAKFPLSRVSEIVSTTLFKASVGGQSTLSLARTTSTPVKSAGTAFPVAHGRGISYRVGEYIYLIPVYAGAYNTVSMAIYRAHVSAPTTWAVLPEVLPVSFGTIQSGIVQYEGYTYINLSIGVYRASFEEPAKWVLYAPAAPISNTPAHVIDGYMYLFGSTTDAKIYRASMSDLTYWYAVGTMPDQVAAAQFWVYGGYMYRAGGSYSAANSYSNKVYRAPVSDPTNWTQIGTLPLNTGEAAVCVVGSKVLLCGGRTDGTTMFRTTVYMSEASNPVTWSALTALTTAVLSPVGYVVGNKAYVAGGYRSGGYTSDMNVYTLSQTASDAAGQVVFQEQNVSLLNTLTSASVSALLGVGYSLKYAVALDGVWYAYDGSTLRMFASMDAALSASSYATLTSGIQYALDGVANLDVSASASLQLALRLETSDVAVYGEILGASMSFVTAQTASPLQITGYTESAGDLGLMHILGDYSATNVKNKTSTPMSVVLKVYDGAV